MLYLIPTPIGNLKDVTLRALETLKEVECVYAENPRHSLKLLHSFSIEKPLYQLNQHSKAGDYLKVIDKMQHGTQVAYISDAGTPGISDPGHELIRYAIAHGISFSVLPGANAVLPAVVASGFVSKDFYFAGFLPLKKGRKTAIERLLNLYMPVVLYESPYRMSKLLGQLVEAGAGDRQIFIGRELSKLHEEYIRGTAQNLQQQLADKLWRGELVVVIA